MKKNLLANILLLFLFSIPFFAVSQETPCAVKTDSSIKVNIIPNGRYTSVLYTFNNEELSKERLYSILNTYPASAEELNKYKGKRTASMIMIPIFLTTLIAASIQADNQKNIPGTPFSKAPVLFSISIGTMITSLFLSGGGNHLHKAIEVYNLR